MAKRKGFNSLISGIATDGENSPLNESESSKVIGRENYANEDRSFKSPVSYVAQGVGKQQEVTYVTIPSSGEEVKAHIRELEPSLCVASRINMRRQKFLTLDNPKFAALYKDIKRTNNQNQPGMVRVVSDGKGDTRYEIVFGLRRHGSCLLIDKELREAGEEFGFKFKAIVVEGLSDLDAYKLSKKENEFREDVSTWEHAMWLKEQRMEGGIYFGKSDSYIAESEGIDRTNVNRAVNAVELDEKWIEIIGDPEKVSLREAAIIANIFKNRTDTEIDGAYKKAKERGNFDGTKVLREFVEGLFKEKKPVSIKRKGIEFNCKSGAKGVVRQKRGSDDEFKVEISNGDADLLDKLITFLKNS